MVPGLTGACFLFFGGEEEAGIKKWLVGGQSCSRKEFFDITDDMIKLFDR